MSINKYKVLHLFNEYLPPTENWAYNMIKSSKQKEIHIGANNYLENEFTDREFLFVPNYYDKPIRNYRKLKNNNLIHIFKKLWIRLLPFLKGSVSHHFTIYARKKNIDLIHCHFGNVGYDFRNVALKNNIPLIVSFYGWDYQRLYYKNPKYKNYIQQLFEQADLFLCEGKYGKKILINQGCQENKIQIQKLGVDYKMHRQKKVSKQGNLKLIQLASFNEKKGHIFSVQAFHMALDKCPNMHLTIAGFERLGNALEKCKLYIEENGLENHISIEPPVNYSELYDYLRKYDVFIHPSCFAANGDCEGGAPVVLLNAQLLGLPIISTYHCDIPSYVKDGITGYLAEEKNVNEIANAIVKFYNMDSNQFANFSNEAHQHVKNNYNLANNAYQLNLLYNDIIESRMVKYQNK